MRWFYFKVHKIAEELKDSYINIEDDVAGFKNARNISPNIRDLPGGNCLWHGYVLAETEEEAMKAVFGAY